MNMENLDFEDDDYIGTTTEIVDLFNQELTDDEWNALCIVQ